MKLAQLSGALFLGAAALISFKPVLAADIEAGKAKTAVCAGCHGADGNSPAAMWPKLAGQHASYLLKQLKDFKSGKRTDPTMQGMVMMLSEEDMANISAYYASQKVSEATFNDALIAQGENIYRGGITETSVASCMSCHSPAGTGNGPAAYPALKGQHADYIAAQLTKFKNQTRANDAGKMMRGVANRMSKEEIDAVSAYIAGLK